jgi:hypothetical protein
VIQALPSIAQQAAARLRLLEMQRAAQAAAKPTPESEAESKRLNGARGGLIPFAQ